MNTFPEDSDGMALKRMAENDMDMKNPIRFEFYIHVESEELSSKVVASLVNAKVGDEVEVVYDEGELEEGEEMTEENKEFWPSWTVYVWREMIPDYEEITAYQETLRRLSEPNGKPDGWGVYQK